MVNMIELDMWKDWILRHVVIKFGCMKMDNGGDITISSHANIWLIYCVLLSELVDINHMVYILCIY